MHPRPADDLAAVQGPLVVVAAVLRDADGRYLACRRRPDRVSGGAWEFPGGKLEPGETPEEAVAREILEELGVRIRVVSHLTTDDTAVGTRVIRLSCYRAEVVGGDPRSSTDHDRLEWLHPHELGGLAWAAPDLPAVALLTAAG